MGYIIVKPRDPARAGGFRGVVFLLPGADKVISAHEEMGGSEHARIEIVRRKDGKAIDIQVHEPPDGAHRGQTTP